MWCGNNTFISLFYLDAHQAISSAGRRYQRVFRRANILPVSLSRVMFTFNFKTINKSFCAKLVLLQLNARISRIISREEIVEDSAVSANINIWTRGEAEWRIKIARGDQNLQPCSRTLMVCGGGYWGHTEELRHWHWPVYEVVLLERVQHYRDAAAEHLGQLRVGEPAIIIEYAQSKIKHLDSKCIS